MTRRVIGLLLAMAAGVARADTYKVNVPEDVSDAAVLDGEFAGWNFGASPLLEAGYMGGIYTEHHAASVVRFDLMRHEGMKVTGAVMRLYKPKDFIQRRPMRVGVYRVTGAWREGADIFGAEGVRSRDSIRVDPRPLATAVVADREGAWVEFKLPAEVVQRWVDEPDQNDGVMVRVEAAEQKEWGDHVYFYSSEHFLGRGPELVIEGTGGGKGPVAKKPAKRRLVLLADDAEVKAWLDKNGRLARFAKELKLEGDGLRVMEMLDTQARERLIVGRYQRPFHDVIGEMPELIAKHDEKAIRERLDRMHELLLKWEYIRETYWYTSGPMADVWSPGQINALFAREIFGTMEDSAQGKGKEIWRVVPDAKMPEHVAATMQELRKRLGLSDAQVEELRPKVAEFERRENEALAEFRQDLARCQDMLKRGEDGPAVFDAVRKLHLHHERFLYWQSIYNTPRWTAFVGHVPTEAFAAWVSEARRDHYDRAVNGANKR